MATLIVAHPLLLAASLGVCCHHAYFIRGEHLLNIPPILSSALLIYIVSIAFRSTVLHRPVVESAVTVTSLYAAFAGGLWSSILIYRVWFHPLHRFPGPFGLKLSKFYHLWSIRGLDQYRWLDALHKAYGPVVRVGTRTGMMTLALCPMTALSVSLNLADSGKGPRHLSICDPDIIELLHGAKSKSMKPIPYDAGHPFTTLQTMRDKTMHDRRRRNGWDQAFTAKCTSRSHNMVPSCANPSQPCGRMRVGY